MSGQPDPRPRRRVRLSPYSYRRLVAGMLIRFPRCECGCGRAAETFHHVISRAHGDDAAENGLMLAGDGVRLCHGAYTTKQRTWDPARETWIEPADVAARLRDRIELVRVDVYAYVQQRKGDGWQAWLERAYPR